MARIVVGSGLVVVNEELMHLVEELDEEQEILYTIAEIKAKKERELRKAKRQQGRGRPSVFAPDTE